MMRWVFVLVLLLVAQPAAAAPIGAAIAAIAGSIGSAIGISAAAVLTVGRLVLSVAISAYQKRRMKKKLGELGQQQSGITTQFVGTGGTTPLTVIVGRYATNGHLEVPQMSQPQGVAGVPANNYLTYVIGLSDLPITGLTGRVVINDDWATLDTAPATVRPEYGQTVLGALQNSCWFRFRDGTQTTADAFLMSAFAAYPERPWSADMIGRGVAHVIATFAYNQDLFPGEPRLRFEVRGIKLYDPRRDSSVGGSGTHRWADRATWEWTENPKVIEYNIHRGIQIDGFGIWGNGVPAEDLPLDNWFAAMNACDLPVDNGAGGTEPSYVFGYEWGLDAEPREIIDEINRSCGGETVEIGGIWKTRVGGVGLPVYFFTDADILVTRAQEMDPFPGLEETFNAISCSFPDPAILWEAREAPPLTNAAWEIEDGALEWDVATSAWVRRPRRLLREVALPAVANARQVQRLISSSVREARKRISHSLPLPPAALVLEPLDAVSWTSARNGYVGKVFEVVLTADPVTELRPNIGLVEADPADFTPPAYVDLGVPSTVNPALPGLVVTGFGVAAHVLTDASGIARRPALRLFWDGPAMSGVRGIAYEIRVAATGLIEVQGTTQRPQDGAVIVGVQLPLTEYEVRATAVTDRPALWTAWLSATTGAELLTSGDLTPGAVTAVEVRIAADPLGVPVVLTPAVPAMTVSGAATGAGAPVQAGRMVVELTLELTAAAPRQVRVRLLAAGAPKGGVILSDLIWLQPGTDYRVLGQDTPGLVLSGTGALDLTVTALGLLTGEDVEITGVRVTRQYWRV